MARRDFQPAEWALLERIHADPRDDTRRLEYADWLDQHGERDHGRFIPTSLQTVSAGTVQPWGELSNCVQILKARCVSPVPQPGRFHCWLRGFPLLRLRVAPLWFTSAQATAFAQRLSPLCFVDVEIDCRVQEDLRFLR